MERRLSVLTSWSGGAGRCRRASLEQGLEAHHMSAHNPSAVTNLVSAWPIWTTRGAALEQGTALLAAARAPSPSLDALTLLMWLLGLPHGVILATPERPLAPDVAARYASWLARRAEGEPVAYITGHKAFMGLDLLVDRRVLLVRASSQALVEAALEIARVRPGAEALLAADVGAGSGAMALALAALEPRFAMVYGTDSSTDALAVARQNGERCRLQQRITWLEGDVLEPLQEPVDVIVANLPFIPEEQARRAPGVARYEPAVAFFSGRDGLDLIRRLVAQTPAKLRQGGALALLALEQQRPVVTTLLQAALPTAQVRSVSLGAGECVLVAQRGV
jgi:release factor glutamine methyltransferase